MPNPFNHSLFRIKIPIPKKPIPLSTAIFSPFVPNSSTTALCNSTTVIFNIHGLFTLTPSLSLFLSLEHYYIPTSLHYDLHTMWISRPLLTKTLHLRYFTQSSAAVALLQDLEVPLTYVDGLPKPDPKYAETIHAVPRALSGKNISAKERKAGRVPSIVFEQEDGQHGGNKRLISVQTNQIKKLVNHLGRSFFLSRLFELEVRPDFESDDLIEKVRVLPRKLHLHAGTDRVLNITFIRAPSHALLKVEVPLVFIGDDVSPGLKKGAYLNIIKRTVKFLCPADVIPPYIEVDLSVLDVGQKLVMGDLKVHPALKLVQSMNEPVCKIMGSRVSEQQKKK